MARYNRLLAVIRGSLKNMALALRGLLVMSGELEAAFNSIALNQVRAVRSLSDAVSDYSLAMNPLPYPC